MYPLGDGLFAPRNHWYVAAWSSEVGRQPFGRWILNEPVAFYRTEAGEAVAIQDRCPHRHFPLSKSRLVGDDIECGYHGLTFDRHGHCVRIPSETATPTAFSIRTYPLVERWNWLWIWPGDPELADESLIPDHDELDITNGEFETLGDIYYPVPGRYMLMHDNLLDLTHLGFLHQSTIASDGLADAREIRDAGEGWISSRREMSSVQCPLFFAETFEYSGAVDRAFGMKSYLPALHSGFDVFSRPADAASRAGEPLGMIRVHHAITPGRLHDAHYFFAFGRNFAREDAAFGAGMIEGLRVTLEEDMSATREIEALLQNLDSIPDEKLLRSDAHCVEGRRIFERLIRAERDDAA